MRFRLLLVIALAFAVALASGLIVLLAGASQDDETGAGDSKILLAAGDIAECPTNADEATAKILGRFPDATIATLGDNAYPDASDASFEECFEPSWGKYKERIRPATGNHDFATKDARGFYNYFGEAGGEFDKYYYSYDLGAWHVVVLNSDCWRVDGCDLDDPQIRWLRRDLASNARPCTLVYMHRPPFSSGRYGDRQATERVRPIWKVLYDEGVDVLLAGHEHSYERLAPMNADGERDDERGVRLFIVGTGGGNLRAFRNRPLPTTERRNGDTWGVLKLLLDVDGYGWEFLPVGKETFTDTGSGSCH